KTSILKLTTNSLSTPIDPTRVTQISWHPRVFIYRNFLTNEECDHFISLAKDSLEKSMVTDLETGESIESEYRTSTGAFLNKAQDEVVANVEARIAAWTFLPEENGEPMQILHYEHGQKYEPHFDYFMDKVNQEIGGHRVATVLMYLSDVDKGGETVFPRSEAADSQPKGDDWSNCAKDGYAVKPKKGDALLFFSLHINATTDRLSLHGSCPVIEGEKWSATKWIHVRSYDSIPSAEKCIDMYPECSSWAASGECDKNPSYMVGTEEYRDQHTHFGDKDHPDTFGTIDPQEATHQQRFMELNKIEEHQMLMPILSEWKQMRNHVLDPKVSHRGVLLLPFLDDALKLLSPKDS
ncbi:hypothetical protein MTR67_010862, partial [Solanum verrucosum]